MQEVIAILRLHGYQIKGRRTILVQRVDFWEESKYGHGGAAKLWPGISGDHDSFKDGVAEEGTPVQRELPVHVQEKEKQDQVFSSVDDFLTWTREYWLNRLNRGYTGKSIAGMYIPTISPKDAQREFGRSKSSLSFFGLIFSAKLSTISKYPFLKSAVLVIWHQRPAEYTVREQRLSLETEREFTE